jgi:hypothetical protein
MTLLPPWRQTGTCEPQVLRPPPGVSLSGSATGVQAGMCQKQLSGRAQVAVATVRKIEKGVVIEPGYFTVLALMHALGAAREDIAGSGPTTSAAQTTAWPPRGLISGEPFHGPRRQKR